MHMILREQVLINFNEPSEENNNKNQTRQGASMLLDCSMLQFTKLKTHPIYIESINLKKNVHQSTKGQSVHPYMNRTYV